MSPSPHSPTPGQLFRNRRRPNQPLPPSASQPLPLLLLLQQLLLQLSASLRPRQHSPHQRVWALMPRVRNPAPCPRPWPFPPLSPPLFSSAAAAQHNHCNINNKTNSNQLQCFRSGEACLIRLLPLELQHHRHLPPP